MTRLAVGSWTLLLLMAGCPSFGDDLPCESDRECYNGQRCVLSLGVCEWIRDAGPASDGGGPSDGGAPPDGGSPSDGGGSTDAGTPADGGTLPSDPRCLVPPCAIMPDSTPGACSDGDSWIPCPTEGDFLGQDGHHATHLPAYDLIAGGAVVEDRVTGLMWMQAPFENRWQQPDAVQECEGLVLGGFDDWRLPSYRELLTLADYGLAETGFVLDQNYFNVGTGVTDYPYWTSTVSAYTGEEFWVVDFDGGPWVFGRFNSPYLVRCVRGTPPVEGDFQPGVGVTTDRRTGLVWQATGLAPDLSWRNALAHCNDLVHGGRDDWRLASLKELMTVVNRAETWPAEFAGYPVFDNGNYWTSTPSNKTSATPRLIKMLDGDVDQYSGTLTSTTKADAVCVAGGAP